MRVAFHGVRGSFPCPLPSNRRYGSNTAAVSLEVDGQAPLLLDLGTGLALADLGDGGPIETVAFVTHLHLDHVQGLPFFAPIHQEGTVLDIYGPPQAAGSLRDAFAGFMEPPYFPLRLDELEGEMRFHEVLQDELAVGSATVTVRPVPHRGPTVGYRVDWDGVAIAYISDHQAPLDLDRVDAAVLELCDGVDLLIHEGQYTREEFFQKAEWGHCTLEYALLVAQEAGARRLCVFHHDPWRSDDELDRRVADLALAAAGSCVEEVSAAAEGGTLTV